jgi:two-component system response regulator DevR
MVVSVASLTARERHVLELLGDARSNRQIAAELVLAEKTVKNYVSSILSKLGMSTRTQAAVFVVRLASTDGWTPTGTTS